MSANFFDYYAKYAQETPDKVLLRIDENELTYSDFMKKTAVLASGMKKINEVTQSSQFGNRTQFGQSGFQKLNAQITAKTAHAASAYSSFTPKPSAGVDVGM